MKWMGWSWSDLEECPDDLIPVIGKLMQDEQREIEQVRQRRR